ncbi:MAG: hypothetical protein NVSMB23_11510 [Myxococcales bacterium]
MLSAAQQERYARHLLVPGLGGEGQERLAAGAALIELPGEAAATALWALRYLAASGVGTVALDGPWAVAAERECGPLWPQTRLSRGAAEAPSAAVRIAEGPASANDVTVVARGLAAADAAALGARAALEVLKRIAGVGRQAPLPLRREDAP